MRWRDAEELALIEADDAREAELLARADCILQTVDGLRAVEDWCDWSLDAYGSMAQVFATVDRAWLELRRLCAQGMPPTPAGALLALLQAVTVLRRDVQDSAADMLERQLPEIPRGDVPRTDDHARE